MEGLWNWFLGLGANVQLCLIVFTVIGMILVPPKLKQMFTFYGWIGKPSEEK